MSFVRTNSEKAVFTNFSLHLVSVTIDKLCDGSHSGFLSSLPRPVDGAVLTSDNERDVDCVITFQTESILERFMLRFERLSIDCNDRLILYDGAHAIGNHRVSVVYFFLPAAIAVSSSSGPSCCWILGFFSLSTKMTLQVKVTGRT